jgi:hypothetical protein
MVWEEVEGIFPCEIKICLNVAQDVIEGYLGSFWIALFEPRVSRARYEEEETTEDNQSRKGR